MNRGIIMSEIKNFLRDKARLNVDIARDLSESFGGSKSDYLIKLNRKLKTRIMNGTAFTARFMGKDGYGTGVLNPGFNNEMICS